MPLCTRLNINVYCRLYLKNCLCPFSSFLLQPERVTENRFLCSSPICNFLLCYLSKMNHTSAAIDNCLPHVIRIDFQLHIVCFFNAEKSIYYLHHLSLHDIPYTLCSLNEWPSSEESSGTVITDHMVKHPVTHNGKVWGFFYRTLKSFQTCAGLPRRCYLKEKEAVLQ